MTKAKSLKENIGDTLRSANQEMFLTLPNQLLRAFVREVHKNDLDPETGKPFASFYRWLWVAPPPGVGLCAASDIDADDIIGMLEKMMARLPIHERADLAALVTDLNQGHGAAKPRGGDRRSKKAREDQLIGTDQLNGRGGSKANRASSLKARMAESDDPKVRSAWQGYLDGKFKSATAAAIACGMRDDANNALARLKSNWRKATAAERRAFREWMKSEGD